MPTLRLQSYEKRKLSGCVLYGNGMNLGYDDIGTNLGYDDNGTNQGYDRNGTIEKASLQYF